MRERTRGSNDEATKVVPSVEKSQEEHGGVLPFLFCATGICSCYLYYGMIQERLFSHSAPQSKGERMGATFLLVTQCLGNVFVAMLWKQVSIVLSPKQNHQDLESSEPLPHSLLFRTSACYVVAMTASNEALQFVSYPTAVLAKSCKLIPIMFFGWLIERKAYSLREWFSALLISSGILLFQLGNSHNVSEQQNSASGLLLLCLSLVMDGCLGACQGLLQKSKRPPDATETMLFVNLYALIGLVPLAYWNGQFHRGLELWIQFSPKAMLFLWHGAAGTGQIFIFLTLTWYSPVICTTITTTRKFFTIMLSVLYFGHHFTVDQWVAIVLVFSGLYLAILAKQKKKDNLDNLKRD